MKYYYQLGDTTPGKWKVAYNHEKLPLDEFACHVAVGDVKRGIDSGDLKMPFTLHIYLAVADATNYRHNAQGLLAPYCVTNYELRIGSEAKPEPQLSAP